MTNETTYFSGGRGHIIVTRGITPAAGASYTVALNNTHFHRLRYMTTILTSDANVIDRSITLSTSDTTGAVYSIRSAIVQTASDFAQWSWAPSVPAIDGIAADNFAQNPIPEDLIISPAHNLLLTVHGIQAGDQLDPIVFVLEDYLAV